MKTFFHIGYPKAGSTSLQKQFFGVHRELNFLGRFPKENTGIDRAASREQLDYLENWELQEFQDLLITDSFDEERCRRILHKYLSSERKLNVISSEFITATFFSHPDIVEKIKRLKKIGVDGIILVLRNQAEIIKSQYREHPFDPEDLVHGKPFAIDEWVLKAASLEHSYLASLQYDQIISTCQELFGSENVVVVLFEDIVGNPREASDEISGRLSLDPVLTLNLLSNMTPENTGVSARYNLVRNFKKHLLGEFPISKFIPKPLFQYARNYFKKGKKASLSYNAEIVSFLNSYYGDSNLQLKKYGIDITKYAYPPYLNS